MLFTIFCCISTGLCVFSILNRVHKRSIEIAVRLAVREVEKEYEARTMSMQAQLSTKDGELKKAQDKAQQLTKLHQIVPSRPSAAAAPVKTQASPAAQASPARQAPLSAQAATAKSARQAKETKDKLKREGLEVFAMSRPFTDTSYDALLAATEVVKVEPKAI